MNFEESVEASLAVLDWGGLWKKLCRGADDVMIAIISPHSVTIDLLESVPSQGDAEELKEDVLNAFLGENAGIAEFTNGSTGYCVRFSLYDGSPDGVRAGIVWEGSPKDLLTSVEEQNRVIACGLEEVKGVAKRSVTPWSLVPYVKAVSGLATAHIHRFSTAEGKERRYLTMQNLRDLSNAMSDKGFNIFEITAGDEIGPVLSEMREFEDDLEVINPSASIDDPRYMHYYQVVSEGQKYLVGAMIGIKNPSYIYFFGLSEPVDDGLECGQMPVLRCALKSENQKG